MKIKWMFILIIGIIIGSAGTYFLAGGKISSSASEEQQTEAETQLYSCGMHPEVISEEPGDCPICGMKLTPVRNTESTSQKQKGKEDEDREILYWRAPMDPTEIYEKPGKSKMGMDLVPVYEGDEAAGAGSIIINGAVQQNMNLRVAPVKKRDLHKTIRAYGEVKFNQENQYTVTTKISGWAEQLFVDTEGDKVRKGQALLSVYSPELVSTQQEYLSAINNLENLKSSPYHDIREGARRVVEITRNRFKLWDISDQEIQKLEKSGEIQDAMIIRSRVSGVVTHKIIKQGDKIGPGMPLYHIANLDQIWVEASVYESELSFIRTGQKAELVLDQLNQTRLEGEVDFIYPFLADDARSNTIRLVFNNRDGLLKPEMYATVYIHIPAAENALAVPSEAVIHTGKRTFVFVSQGEGRFEPREVKPGMETDAGYIEIASGLLEGEEVVTSGQFLLDSESRTREAIAKMRRAAAEQADKHTEHIDSLDHLYTCPMHPDFLTTDPEAECPECGMDLVPARELDDKIDLENTIFYTCSMHPEFLTTDPEGRCPECGMKLEKFKKDND